LLNILIYWLLKKDKSSERAESKVEK